MAPGPEILVRNWPEQSLNGNRTDPERIPNDQKIEMYLYRNVLDIAVKAEAAKKKAEEKKKQADAETDAVKKNTESVLKNHPPLMLIFWPPARDGTGKPIINSSGRRPGRENYYFRRGAPGREENFNLAGRLQGWDREI